MWSTAKASCSIRRTTERPTREGCAASSVCAGSTRRTRPRRRADDPAALLRLTLGRMRKRTFATLFCLGFQPRHELVAAPKFNIVTVDKALRPLDCLRIVATDKWLESYEMPVVADYIGPVLCHARPTSTFGAERDLRQIDCPVCSLVYSTIQIGTAPVDRCHGRGTNRLYNSAPRGGALIDRVAYCA